MATVIPPFPAENTDPWYAGLQAVDQAVRTKVTSLPDNVAAVGHTHTYAEITGTAPAPPAHTHTAAQITDLATALAPYATIVYVDSRIWKGTQAAYDAIVTKDPTVLYVVTG